VTKAKMPVIIRPLRAADQVAWTGLWTAYLEFYGTALPSDIFTSTFGRLLGDDPQDFSGLVAEVDGDLIGLTHYLFHRHGWKIENVCYLQDLYVSPAARGTGCGRKLIEAVYAAADAQNAPNVYWLTQDDNTTGRQLYDRVGSLTNFIKYQRPAA
jgi:GNAT superfamily N-acetyltransferase